MPVTGTFTDRAGNACVGRITFSSRQVVVIDGVVVIPKSIATPLVNGSIPVGFTLPATNDPDLSLTGWAYTVKEAFPSGRDEYAIFVDHAAASIDLASVAPVVPPPELVSTRGPAGPIGPSGPPGSAGANFVEFPAAVPLGGHRAVRLQAGQAVYANSTATADAHLVLGLTLGAVDAGGTAQIQTTGVLAEPSWAWTPDLPVFCGLAGGLTQIAPTAGFSLIVGTAVSPTAIFIGAKSPIVL